MKCDEVFRLEMLLIPWESERWQEAPEALKAEARKDAKEGYPVGLGYDTKEHGWIMMACGQGPFLVYSEKRDGPADRFFGAEK